MNCPECNAWSEVKETRKLFGGVILRRRRLCANAHAFTSHEIPAPLYTRAKYFIPLVLKIISKKHKRFDLAMKVYSDPGTSKEVAAKYGISPRYVRDMRAKIRKLKGTK